MVADVALWLPKRLALPIVVAALTAAYMTRRGTSGRVADHDRQAAEFNEDLRRWVRDRGREASLRIGAIAQQAAAGVVASDGALRQAAGKMYRQVLHEYRDEATRKRRQLAALVAGEGRARPASRGDDAVHHRPSRSLTPADAVRAHDAFRAVRDLVQRGRDEGAFRTDLSADWLVTAFFALLHACSEPSCASVGR